MSSSLVMIFILMPFLQPCKKDMKLKSKCPFYLLTKKDCFIQLACFLIRKIKEGLKAGSQDEIIFQKWSGRLSVSAQICDHLRVSQRSKWEEIISVVYFVSLWHQTEQDYFLSHSHLLKSYRNIYFLGAMKGSEAKVSVSWEAWSVEFHVEA